MGGSFECSSLSTVIAGAGFSEPSSRPFFSPVPSTTTHSLNLERQNPERRTSWALILCLQVRNGLGSRICNFCHDGGWKRDNTPKRGEVGNEPSSQRRETKRAEFKRLAQGCLRVTTMVYLVEQRVERVKVNNRRAQRSVRERLLGCCSSWKPSMESTTLSDFVGVLSEHVWRADATKRCKPLE
jgi:hypothetical protein